MHAGTEGGKCAVEKVKVLFFCYRTYTEGKAVVLHHTATVVTTASILYIHVEEDFCFE